jgi:hypothetical protein
VPFVDGPVPRVMYVLVVAALLACGWAIAVLQRRKPMVWVWWQTLGNLLIALSVMLGLETTIDNARSAKALCAELQSRLGEPDTAVLRSRLPEEVAVYLPLKEEDGMARHVFVIVDDQFAAHGRSKKLLPPPVPPPSNFQSSFPFARVLFVDRVEMKSMPGDARWKVFELTVDRMRYAAN